MKYKLINTGNTDQHLPISHGKKKHGVVGYAGGLPNKIIIPGLARVEDGKNNLVIEEEDLRSIFGLYQQVKPGVIDRSKPLKISPENVKFNTRILDRGRIIVTDEFGNHIFGVGGTAYQKSALDSVKSENEMLKAKLDNFTALLVSEGYSEEDANAIVNNKIDKAQAILGKKEIGVRGKGVDLDKDNDSGNGTSTLDAAKEFFADRENVTVFAGDDVVKEYKIGSLSHALAKITKLSEEAGIEVIYDDNNLPLFTDSDGRVVRLG